MSTARTIDAVPKGYKRTEVGVVPEEWGVATIGGACEAVLDCHHSTPEWTEFGPVVVRNQNIRNGKLDQSNLSRTNEEHFKERTRRAVPTHGDLIISREAPVGLVCAVPEGMRCCLGQRMVLLRIDAQKAVPQYVLYSLLSRAAQRDMRDLAGSGSTVANLRIPSLKSLMFPLPPLPEQRAIATALSDADDWIASLERLIAKKRRIKQGAMQELLSGRRRLEGFEGGWEVDTLGNLTDVRSGGTPSTVRDEFWDGGIPWCTPTDITRLAGHKTLAHTERTISREGLDASSAELIPARSLIMTTRATIGACAVNSVPMSTNQGFKNLIPSPRIDIDFLYYRMLTETEGLIALCGGSTFLEISKAQVSSYPIAFPPLPEQRAIATHLTALDTELTHLESKLEKARRVKEGMMGELLGGRVRLV